ncbi:fibrinogen-like protein 1 [Lucilia cuprina]|uniref:fibrinogen-like protein 1 n=1 Tax=Lucilia cuprina TaxID=7375 RepID=UPI001F055211|nr:fibrinogen-like protein 1 [Lucilia cuprina]
MQYKIFALLILLFLLIQLAKAEKDVGSSDETISSSNLVHNVDSIRNQLKNIKAQVVDKYENEKLLWQLEAFESWYGDEEKSKCSVDLSYVFNGWTPIQRRLDGTENFYRNWSDYQQGFGDKHKEFFMGLEPLHQLIKTKGPQELLIILGDHDKHIAYAKYDNFIVGSEADLYELKDLGSYVGSAGDALSEQVGKKFTTLDRDNDGSKLHNCAKLWHSAWWFGYCHQSHLNGPYLEKSVSEKGEKGIVWDLWHGMNYSLKFVLMMVRSKAE